MVPETRTVVVGPEEGLFHTDCVVQHLNLFDARVLSETMTVSAKIRYASPPAPARVHPGSAGTLVVRFSKPQRAITPGQSMVFYDDDTLLGGGIIR